jgi:hypothetical protein
MKLVLSFVSVLLKELSLKQARIAEIRKHLELELLSSIKILKDSVKDFPSDTDPLELNFLTV